MRVCPDCHAVIQGTANFCDNCGYSLGSVPAEPAAVSPATGRTLVGRAIPGTCSSCGYQNVPGEMFCQNCGVQLAPITSTPPPFPTLVSRASSTTAAQPELHSETVEPVNLAGLPRLALHLVVRSNNAVIVLDKDRDEWLVGRSDPVRGIFPEVDLSHQGGEENGVSRRQARLVLQEGRCFISDLNSTNFTFLNGEKLQPGRLYPLKPGDEIRFGLLALTYYEEIDK